MSTVATLKEGSGYVPVLLCAFTFQGGSLPQLLLSTHPFDGTSGPAFPGIGFLPAGNYVARIAQQDISALQQKSQQGIDRIAQMTVHIFDADSFIWLNYVQPYGFRGATLQMALVMWQPGTTNWSDDAPVMFVGTCDMEVPQRGYTMLAVSANNSHNTAAITLPLFPIENRCPKSFPATQADRYDALANPQSKFRVCGYSPDYASWPEYKGTWTSGGTYVIGDITTSSGSVWVAIRPNSGGAAPPSAPSVWHLVQPIGNIATTGGPSNNGKNVVDAYGNIVTDNNGVYLLCDFLRSDPTRTNLNAGCMARQGNYATTSVAPDGDIAHDTSARQTGVFAGVQWSPGTYYAINKNYTSNSKIATFSYINSGILGQYHNLLYGKQWVNAKAANVIESGNDTKCEAMICSGNIGFSAIDQVLVQGVLVQLGNSDLELTWRWVSTGDRGGNPTTDSGYSTHAYLALGDPYGSIATIETVVYSDIVTGFTVPSIQVLCSGPQLYAYLPDLGGIFAPTLLAGVPDPNNPDYDPAAAYAVGAVVNYGNSQFFCTASNTGGFYPGYNPNVWQMTASPAWTLLDILVKANWTVDELDLETFYNLSGFCQQTIEYINQANSITIHPRFKSQFVLEERKKVSEVVAGILRSFSGYTAWSQSGLLQVFCNQTLYDSQPAPIDGSNYNTPVASATASFKGTYAAANTYSYGDVVVASGVYYQGIQDLQSGHTPASSPTFWSIFGTGSQPVGYVAYSFDETNILRIEEGGDVRLDVEGEFNPTANTPNQIYIRFQDEDNAFVQDSLSEVNADAAARAAGALQPGGSQIPETLNVLGISNFDQGVRCANVYMAERQYGNEGGDARGTRVFTIATTVRCESLRVGHIVFLSIQKCNITLQECRVIKIAPTTDFMSAKVTLQWHEDLWYLDLYGQAPQDYYSQNSFNSSPRIPLPWQPDEEIPLQSDLYSSTEWNFTITETDAVTDSGSVDITLSASGSLPINTILTNVQPPRVPSFASVSITGGFIAGNQSLYIEIVAYDSTGLRSAPSQVIAASVPPGTNTNSININNVAWFPDTAGYDIYVGTDHFDITFQHTHSGVSGTSILITTLPNFLSGAPPDLVAACALGQGKQILHAGIIGETVVSTTSTTVTIGAPGFGTFTADLTTHPHHLMLIGRPGVNTIPIVDLLITSYTVGGGGELILHVNHNPTTLFSAGDAVVVTAGGNINSTNTIGDAAAAYANGNTYYPPGTGAFTGNTVGQIARIIAKTGRYQFLSISSVSADGSTVTLASNWPSQPDDTSVFIIESSTWFPGALSENFACSVNNLSTEGLISQDVGNITGLTVLFQVLIGDAAGTNFSSSARSPFRIYYVFGQAGSGNLLNPGYYTITPVGSLATVDFANSNTTPPGLNQRVVLSTNSLTISAPAYTGGVIQAGMSFTLYLDQDSTGGWGVPAFTGGAGGFVGSTQAQVQALWSPTLSTRTSLVFTYHGTYWSLDSEVSGSALS